MKKTLCVLILGLLAGVFGFSSTAQAGRIDILVERLVEKGVLTPMEGSLIIDETKQEVAKDLAQGKSDLLPAWVQRMKLSGDLRVRYQWQKRKGSANDRHRGRYRFRIGVTTQIVDMVEVGFGLATGSGDPRSTNQTMQKTFQTEDIRIDYAYAKWTPDPRVDVYLGKFKRGGVLWSPTGAFWKGDINPHGISVALTETEILDGVDLFFNAGAWPLDDLSGANADPFLGYVQAGAETKLLDNMKIKGAVTQYFMTGLKGKTLEHSSKTNTGAGSSGLTYNYNVVSPAMQLNISNPLGKDFKLIPYAGLLGEYFYNPDPSEKNQGFAVGLRFGHSRVRNAGQWQMSYTYSHIGKDAWLDTFTDSDAYGGATGVKGYNIKYSYGLNSRVALGLAFYHMELVDRHSDGTRRPENLFQSDISFRF